jgi:hypothetical protein
MGRGGQLQNSKMNGCIEVQGEWQRLLTLVDVNLSNGLASRLVDGDGIDVDFRGSHRW